jgi:hypothetical protein
MTNGTGRKCGIVAATRLGRLMSEVLEHERYLIHGGDHGAVVADWLTGSRSICRSR